MYGYIYRTHNLVNGKMYVGQKKSSEFLGTRYLGSSRHLGNAIKKYGRENFSVELIESCNSVEELNEREIYWISHYDAVRSDNYYNLSPGGNGNPLYHLSKERREEILIKRRLYTNKKISKAGKGREVTDRIRKAVGKSSHMRLTGTRYINNGEIELRIPKDEAEDMVKNKGFRYGRKDPVNVGRVLSEETKRKIGESRRGKKATEDTRRKLADAASILHKGRHYINNGSITKKVLEKDIDKYLSDGWKLGMIRKSKGV